ELEKEILETSLRFGVLCRFTAFVAVDRAAVVNAGGRRHKVTQAVEKPAGGQRGGEEKGELRRDAQAVGRGLPGGKADRGAPSDGEWFALDGADASRKDADFDLGYFDSLACLGDESGGQVEAPGEGEVESVDSFLCEFTDTAISFCESAPESRSAAPPPP